MTIIRVISRPVMTASVGRVYSEILDWKTHSPNSPGMPRVLLRFPITNPGTLSLVLKVRQGVK